MALPVLMQVERYRETLRSWTKQATLEEFTITTFNDDDLLVFESVDEGAHGADATFRDELIMMACFDLVWKENFESICRKNRKKKGGTGRMCSEVGAVVGG